MCSAVCEIQSSGTLVLSCVMCSSEQGARPTILCYADLSRGLEEVPILCAGTSTGFSVSPFDTPFTYSRSPILHQSVSVEALDPSRHVHVFPICTSDSIVTTTSGECSTTEATAAGVAYLDSGVVHPRFITEVSASISSFLSEIKNWLPSRRA